jgi:hypothetical protein
VAGADSSTSYFKDAKPVKRGLGCPELGNNKTYTSNGSTFNINCNTSWGATALFLTYTPDFETCIEQCAIWNRQNAGKCAGVTWTDGTYGPLGVSGGSECLYFWILLGETSSPGTDAAQLLNYNPPTVMFRDCHRN